jgi:hypothetical protein
MFSERPVELGPVNIHQVLDHVRRIAQTGFAAHLKFSEEYDPSLPPVWGNRDILVQIILNLVKNAAEAVDPMHGEIVLATAYQHGVRIAVPTSTERVHLPLLVTVREDGVECEAMNPIRRCTPLSIANHSLHENSSPIHHIEPGGMLDTSDCRFDALTDRAVRISGMRWTPASQYTVKLEGVEMAGYRSISICGTRDPLLIARLPLFLEEVRGIVQEKAQAFGAAPESYTLTIRTYGLDGVMGAREPVRDVAGHEVGFVIEVIADTQEIAAAVLGIARTNMLHTDFPGRLCREGNMAFPFSPSDIPVGPVYRFSIYHVLELDDPREIFPISYEEV